MAWIESGTQPEHPQSCEATLTELTTTLRRAFTVALGPDLAADALGEAMAYFAEHEGRVRTMTNPVGYLYTVGRRRAQRFRRPRRSSSLFPQPASVGLPEVEPRLVDSIALLSERQRVCVVLVHGFGYSHREVAELLGISIPTVQTHCRRALEALRDELGDVR